MATQPMFIKHLHTEEHEELHANAKLLITTRKTQGSRRVLGTVQPPGLQWHLLDCVSCLVGTLRALSDII